MNFKKVILVVTGEPNSVFLELFFKIYKKKNKKSNYSYFLRKTCKTTNEKAKF